MNSKERVRKTLALGVPDRVPYGEFAIDFDTAGRLLGHKTYYRNKAGILMAVWEGRWEEMAQSVIEDSLALVEKVEQDIIPVPILPAREQERPRKVDESTWEFADGRVLKYSPVTNDFTVVHYPQRDYLPSQKDIEAAAEGRPWEDYRLEAVRRMVARYGSEKYIVCGAAVEVGMPLFGGMENGLMYYLTDPGRIKAYIDAATEGAAKSDDVHLGLGCDAVFWGTDYAYNAGPFLSPAMFGEMLLPSLKARVEAIHRRGIPVIQHACGNNWPILDGFVEAGIDCYQSIQSSAGMELAPLKAKYGGKMALWGGVAVENLVSGTPDDVAADVRRAMEAGKPGGGFILGASHSICYGTKYDNYMRMLEEYHRLRPY